jgi:hypothetical protein
MNQGDALLPASPAVMQYRFFELAFGSVAGACVNCYLRIATVVTEMLQCFQLSLV